VKSIKAGRLRRVTGDPYQLCTFVDLLSPACADAHKGVLRRTMALREWLVKLFLSFRPFNYQH